MTEIALNCPLVVSSIRQGDPQAQHALELGIVTLTPGFAAREIDLFQTYCSCTSPSSAAINGPVQRANPAGGSRSI
jgi:hypothetical protein